MGLASSAYAQDRRPTKNLTLLGIPSATVAPHGTAFMALAGTTKRSAITSDDDGAFAAGIGFGSAERNLGFQLTGHVTSLSDSIGDSGYFAVKASRRVSQGSVPVYVGISAENLLKWGDVKSADTRGDAMITFFPQFATGSGETYPLMLTFGVGTDRRNNDSDVGPFAGAGIGLTETLGASASWTGDQAAFGISFRPRQLKNLNMTAVVEDAFDHKNERRLTVSVNWIFNNIFGG